jgi:hypothetical protein
MYLISKSTLTCEHCFYENNEELDENAFSDSLLETKEAFDKPPMIR